MIKAAPHPIAAQSPVTRKPALSKSGNASPSGGLSVASQVRRANRWRENYNPLRGLVMARVVDLLEQGERGEYADLQWLYRFVEKRDAVLRAIIKRRRAALQKLDWEIKVVAELPEGATEQQAAAQKQTLRTAYDFIDNLREAISFLALAEFRGFAHVQKHYADGAVRHLECLPQWNWIRDGINGPWFYNAEAQNLSATALAQRDDAIIDPVDFLIREEDMPIDEIAVIAYLRKNLSQKDWDAFVEIFGIPGCVVIGPPGVQAEKESEYQSAAESVAEGASGYLPNGSDAKFADSPRGTNPFKEHLDQQNSDLVLAGTGGKLTMLNEATGLGSGNADAHDDAFDDLAVEEAGVISEIFQKQFDAALLAEHHAGEPVLAYFEICAKDEADVTALAAQVAQFSAAGFEADAEELSEKTGLTLTKKEPMAMGAGPGASRGFDPESDVVVRRRMYLDSLKQDNAAPPLANRTTPATGLQQLAQAFADDLQPLRLRLERILQIEDETILRTRLEAFRGELPQLLKDINADPAAAGTLEQLLAGGLAAGMSGVIQNKAMSEDDGKWVTVNGSPVFIPDGQSVKDVMDKKFSDDKAKETAAEKSKPADKPKEPDPKKETRAPEKSPAASDPKKESAPADKTAAPEPPKKDRAAAVKFKSVSEAKDFADSTMHPEKRGFDIPTKGYLRTYQDDSSELNGVLLAHGGSIMPNRLRPQVAALDAAMEKSKLPAKMELYHGSGDKAGWGKLNVGETISNPAYLSTTLASDQTTFKRGVWIKVEAPKGAKGVYMDDLMKGRGTEVEVLLPRNAKFKVSKKTIVGTGPNAELHLTLKLLK